MIAMKKLEEALAYKEVYMYDGVSIKEICSLIFDQKEIPDHHYEYIEMLLQVACENNYESMEDLTAEVERRREFRGEIERNTRNKATEDEKLKNGSIEKDSSVESLVESFIFPRYLMEKLFEEREIIDIDYNYFNLNPSYEDESTEEIQKHLIVFMRMCQEDPDDFERIYTNFSNYLLKLKLGNKLLVTHQEQSNKEDDLSEIEFQSCDDHFNGEADNFYSNEEYNSEDEKIKNIKKSEICCVKQEDYNTSANTSKEENSDSAPLKIYRPKRFRVRRPQNKNTFARFKNKIKEDIFKNFTKYKKFKKFNFDDIKVVSNKSKQILVKIQF
jgi:hypothetical protein